MKYNNTRRSLVLAHNTGWVSDDFLLGTQTRPLFPAVDFSERIREPHLSKTSLGLSFFVKDLVRQSGQVQDVVHMRERANMPLDYKHISRSTGHA